MSYHCVEHELSLYRSVSANGNDRSCVDIARRRVAVVLPRQVYSTTAMTLTRTHGGQPRCEATLQRPNPMIRTAKSVLVRRERREDTVIMLMHRIEYA
jgi:hypothetical protein